MWNVRTRLVLLYAAFLLLFGLSGTYIGVPGFDLIGTGDLAAGWLRVGCWIVVDAAVIIGAMALSRRPAFRAEPVDWTLPRAERRRLQREEEERYRRSRGTRDGSRDGGPTPEGD